MSRRILAAAALCVGAAVGMTVASSPASAAPTAGSVIMPNPHQLGLEVGADPGLGLELSYGYRIADLVRHSSLVPTATFGFPIPGVADGRTFDASLGASWIIPFYRGVGGGVGMTATTAFFLSSAQTSNANLVGLGVDVGVLPGYYHDKGFIALALGYRPTLTTSVIHRQLSHDTFTNRYPGSSATEEGPQDGWYGLTGHSLRVGVEGGGTIAERVTLYAGGGLQASPSRLRLFYAPDVGIIPFYARAGVATHF